MYRKVFQVFLSIVLVLGLMPGMAFAAPAKDTQSKSSTQEKTLKSPSVQESLLKTNIESGPWGDCTWEWDHSTETITVKPGATGQTRVVSDAPWHYTKFTGGAPNGGVKHIIFKENNGKKVILPEDSSFLFQGRGSSEVPSTIETIDFSGVDSSQTTNFEYFFSNCSALTSIDLSPLNTSNGENFGNMFYGCTSLTTLDVSPLDISNATNISAIFAYCTGLTSINLSNFDTSNVELMEGVFAYCIALTSLDLSLFNTSNVEDMNMLFAFCVGLKSLDLSSFFTDENTNMEGMFEYCGSLERVVIGENIEALPLLPSVEINGHEDWYSSYRGEWLDSQGVNDNCLGNFDTLTKWETKTFEDVEVSNIVDKAYTGSPITQTPVLTDDDYTLVEGTDYTLSYKNNINPGTAEVIFKGIGKYVGTIKKTFTITSKKPISSVTVSGIEDMVYTGRPITQKLRLTDGNYVLREDIDYSVVYKNNFNIGTASIIITGSGSYEGTRTETFEITATKQLKKPIIVTQPAKQTTVKTGTTKPFTVKVKAKATRGGKLTYQWYSNGSAVKGATSASLTVDNPNTLKKDSYSLVCVVTETAGGQKASVKSTVSTVVVKRPNSISQVAPLGDSALLISWDKVDIAVGYDVFFSRCNYGKTEMKCKKIKTLKGNDITSYVKKNLRPNTCYKCFICPFIAIGGKKYYLAIGPQMHVYTSGGSKKYTDPKDLKINQNKVSLKTNKSFQLKSKVIPTDPKKKIISTGHAPLVRYKSTDLSVAKVSDTGKIVGVSKGTCTVYAYTQNGIKKACKVSVS